MAFVSALSTTSFAPARASASKLSSIRASRPVVARSARRAALAPAPVTMQHSGEQYPTSDVLGLGKDVPSQLYALASAPAFLFGCWAVYQSNIANVMTAESIDPQFIVGSLALPISWGLHVAAFIQKENGK